MFAGLYANSQRTPFQTPNFGPLQALDRPPHLEKRNVDAKSTGPGPDPWFANGELVERCPICFDAPADVETKCQHRFCKDCLRQWLDQQSTCPVCRASLQHSYTGSLAEFSVCLRLYRVRLDSKFPRWLRWMALAAKRLQWWLTIEGNLLGIWSGRHRLLYRACYDVARMTSNDVDTTVAVRLGADIATVQWKNNTEASARIQEWFALAANARVSH